MFNPKEYWERRKEGLRGQDDEKPFEVVEVKQPEHMVQAGAGVVMVNRKKARQKLPSDPKYTKKRSK